MGFKDKVQGNGQPSGFKDFSQSAGQHKAEGGNEMVLAVTAQVQKQAVAMQQALQAANISIDHASDQLSDHFAYAMGGRQLVETTLSKTFAKLEQQGIVDISAEVPEIKLDLPPIGGFESTRQRFLSAFAGNQGSIPNPFLKPAEEQESVGE